MKFIPYGHQAIDSADIQEVVSTLQSEFLTQGPKVSLFEKMIAMYCESQHAVAVCNATAALHLACLALGVGKGCWVWTSPISFVASANCALYCGAQVDFVDICSITYNMDVNKLSEKLKLAEINNCLPKVVIPVHFAGHACDMKKIKELADQYHFKIIEDASHAIGGKYLGKPIGNCNYSDITVFSFHPVKIITTGEGGVCTTNSPELSEKIKMLRTHGITRDPKQMAAKDEGDWYYEQIHLGYNYRITDIQCALGISQLKKVDVFVKRRADLVERYNEILKTLPLIKPTELEYATSSHHLYVIRLDREKTRKTRRKIFDELRSAGIGVNVHYIPIYKQPYYKKIKVFGEFPVSEFYYETAITLPLYPELNEINFISKKLHEALECREVVG